MLNYQRVFAGNQFHGWLEIPHGWFDDAPSISPANQTSMFFMTPKDITILMLGIPKNIPIKNHRLCQTPYFNRITDLFFSWHQWHQSLCFEATSRAPPPVSGRLLQCVAAARALASSLRGVWQRTEHHIRRLTLGWPPNSLTKESFLVKKM